MRTEKILKYTLCRLVDPSKKVPDLNCEVQDLLLEVVDLKQEVPDLRSGGIRPNLTPAADCVCVCLYAGSSVVYSVSCGGRTV